MKNEATLQSHGEMQLSGELTITVLEKGRVVEKLGPFKNKVVSSSGYGRNLLLRQMIGDTTYPIVINSVAIGTGTTTPADGDTALVTPVVSSIPISNTGLSNNILTIDVFVTDATLANGTYKEFGLFMSSRLFSRLLITPNYTKASGQDTLFTYTLTFTG